MPEWLVKIFGGDLGSTFKDIVGSFKADPTEIIKLQALIEQNKDVLAQKQIEMAEKAADVEAQLNETAGKNIRAEADSGDPWVRRARPMVIWVGLFIMTWNYCLIPLIPGKTVVAFPDMFWNAWMIVATGYVFARTGDKLFGGQGGSVSFLGMKADSKGDK